MTKRLLVIGGGVGGLSAIAGFRKLDQETEICLVEPKEFCEIFWAAYRSPFDPTVAQASLLPLQPFCDKYKVRHVATKVTSLTHDEAKLEAGTVETFDSCIVCTGASCRWPGLGRSAPVTTRQARLEQLQAEGSKLLSAKSVLIVGGGLIGSELAGDVAGFAKKKATEDPDYTPPKITLVHSRSYLCPEFTQHAAAKVQKKMEGLGVTVILNELIEEANGSVVCKNSGKPLEAEQVVWTIGLQSMNQFLEIPNARNENGWIVTDEYCRITVGDGKLFAFGDCCTHMPNSGNHLFNNADTIGNNLKASLVGNGLKRIKPNPTFICCTVGPDDGIFYTPLFSTQYVVPGIKNSNMFLPFFKKAIGYPE